MSKINYNPKSHFFVDHINLSNPLPVDGFGPIEKNATNQYRVTSFVRALTTKKVFAICDSQMLIQPYDGDESKVNVILKPLKSFAPYKVKYFIYRGVRKEDIIDQGDIALGTLNSPDFIKRFWQAQNNLYQSLNEPLPPLFNGSQIGYAPESQPNDDLLSSVFHGTGSLSYINYNIPKCFKGELIGYFNEKIGLDIVIDYGDYELDYEEQQFKFDLEYARKNEQVFDVSGITNAVKKKRYREYIHQFIDAAAFWGSHINTGEIQLFNTTNSPISNKNDIYDSILNKYYTKNKLYFYIQSEKENSFNHFGDYPTGKVSLEMATDVASTVDYKTDDWPILIKDFILTSLPQQGQNVLDLTLDFEINTKIHGTDVHLPIYITSPFWTKESFPFTGNYKKHPLIYSNLSDRFSGQTTRYKILFRDINFYSNTSTFDSMSSFAFIKYKGIQKHPLESYFNKMFGLMNIKSTLNLPNQSTNLCHWVSSFKTYLVNLNDIISKKNILLNNKLIFDKGKDSNGLIKERRLYITFVSDLLGEFNEGISNSSGFEENLNQKNYENSIYGNTNFKVYKGQIFDGSSIIKTLSLVSHENQSDNNIFQLGITEEEYNLLIYDNIIIPTPPSASPHIPTDITNIRFFLNEDIGTLNDITKDFRKYELGLEYEDTNGTIQKKYPSTQVIVYTIDGKYFFSKEYSEFQEFYKSFANCRVDFRPNASWNGEFGVDWVRRGDSNVSGDIPNNSYRTKVGHYYTKPLSNLIKIPLEHTDQTPGTFSFKNEKPEWIKLKTQYNSYPISFGDDSQYCSAFASLYPSLNQNNTPSRFPLITSNGSQKCLTEGEFELNIEINVSPTSLRLQYDKSNFEVISLNPSTTTQLPDVTINNIIFSELEIIDKTITSTPRKLDLKIKCLQEYSCFKHISVKAINNGVEELAGQIIFVPNDKNARKEVELVFVNIQTQLIPVPTAIKQGMDITLSHDKISEDIITKFLNQAVINIKNIDILDLDLKLASSHDPNFDTDYNIINPSGINCISIKSNSSSELIFRRLLDQTKLQHPSYNQNAFVIFFIDEIGYLSSSSLEFQGLSEPKISNNGFISVIFKDGLLRNVIPHELLHKGGLYHSFSNLNDISLEYHYTNNIMDYSELIQPPLPIISTNSTSKSQWKTVRKHTKIFNE